MLCEADMSLPSDFYLIFISVVTSALHMLLVLWIISGKNIQASYIY